MLSHFAVRMNSRAAFSSPPPSPSVPPLPLSSSPALALCPELELSVLASPAPEPPKQHVTKQRGQKRKTKVCYDQPAVVKVISEPHISPKSGATSERVELKAAVSYDYPDKLEEVELNSTLALKAQLLALQGAEFNTHKAVQETLQKVEKKKQINNRATQGINVSWSQTLFNSLVSVDVPESDLLSQAVKDKLHVAPPTRSQDNKAAASPSLVIFLTPDLFRQKPLPVEEERVNSTPVPRPRPGSSTFDLYRRRCRWEATP
ncbi:protein phosphatase 1 regulatory subunit 35 isoform X2 [Stigmatopora nigra]